MTSKIIEGPKPEPKPEFPCLRVSKTCGQVVLFSAPHKGIVVHQGGGYVISYSSDSWDDYSFTPFTGKVELSN